MHCPGTCSLNQLCVPHTVLLFPAAELQSVLEPFLLRRVKSEVAVDLPKKTELVMYHGMSALQKKYYKALLMKDLGEKTATRPVNLCFIALTC